MSQEQITVKKLSHLSRCSQDDVLRLLDNLEEMAEDAPKFMGKTWGLDADDFFALTNKIRASLPDEMRRASRVANDSDKIVAAAKEEAEMILEQAREEAERVVEDARQMAAKLVDTSEINRLAKAQAQDIMANAESASREVRRGADEYAMEVLAAIENHLAKVMGTMQKGREKLEMRINAQQPSEQAIPAGRGIRR